MAPISLALECANPLDPVRPTTNAQQGAVVAPTRVPDVVRYGDARVELANRLELLRELLGVQAQVHDVVVLEAPRLHVVGLVVVALGDVAREREVPVDLPDAFVLHALNGDRRLGLWHRPGTAEVFASSREADILLGQPLVGVDSLRGHDQITRRIVTPSLLVKAGEGREVRPVEGVPPERPAHGPHEIQLADAMLLLERDLLRDHQRHAGARHLSLLDPGGAPPTLPG
mmetsp:Transcript_99097/g.296118  ORF Transcript_99097/g.296118 Transcript_99097/m.296118 type:complete len:229 (+) Transcript_99097:804-1490(+)